jgi:hypothetical protein
MALSPVVEGCRAGGWWAGGCVCVLCPVLWLKPCCGPSSVASRGVDGAPPVASPNAAAPATAGSRSASAVSIGVNGEARTGAGLLKVISRCSVCCLPVACAHDAQAAVFFLRNFFFSLSFSKKSAPPFSLFHRADRARGNLRSIHSVQSGLKHETALTHMQGQGSGSYTCHDRAGS